jgi:hypothetical protein
LALAAAALVSGVKIAAPNTATISLLVDVTLGPLRQVPTTWADTRAYLPDTAERVLVAPRTVRDVLRKGPTAGAGREEPPRRYVTTVKCSVPNSGPSTWRGSSSVSNAY